MRELFNMDGPIFRFLSRMADLMLLNIVFIICSLPVITIGASVTAMSYVSLKMKDDEGYVVRSFFKSFKQNLKQSTVIWLLMLFLALVLGLDTYILRQLDGTVYTVMQVVVYIGILLWVMIFVYVFPIQARFYNTIRGTLRNAVLLSIGNLPKTLCMVVVTAGAAILTFLTVDTIIYGMLVWILIGFALVSYCNCSLLYGIFKKLIEASQEPETQENEELLED
ncbi:MAG: DUF624 domain-containing protein [Lachnospiraceae bacterium]|nr:DUF624 domain-containing protein [Lachnospiraceae bacterium]